MKILAIDSSSVVATVALVEDEKLLAEYSVNHKKTHSQTLLPMIDEIMKMSETDINTLDAIAVSGGPGSFTGLRIGSATAKGLALVINKPIIHIPTIDGLAYNMYGSSKLVCPIMDARRNQVYTGIYHFEDNRLVADIPQYQEDINTLIEILNEKDLPVVFLGDGVDTYRETISHNIKVPYEFAPVHMNMQRAASIAALSEQYYIEKKTVSANEHQPDYLRKSQAERELEEKHNMQKIIQ
ncbi:MAG: tRNA (adenosine(37)-N6)-threonylcarbamoyltransferase complex dimerization subunit type 1 TsaB [Lachnospiraceae bacterium]|nr:tRNA (adenosine(37)-N6)-threonylcarbamoyltransferase complex dimerization subunit type 1 TsaB [Lachnospiraceae bacterium]